MDGEKELLLEIGTEEIPARFIPGALEALKTLAGQRLDQARLDHRGIRTWGTPRRLTLSVDNVSAFQKEQEEKIIGPPRSAAFDAQGNPTSVAVGFARAKGVRVEDLVSMETPKGVYMGVIRKTQGLPALEVLSGLLPQLIHDLHFPKFMRWGTSAFRFVRPIHWILALLGDQVVPFTLEGIPSGRVTYGHRFMSPDPIVIQNPGEYAARLKEAQVLVDPEERRKVLLDGVEEEARRLGGKILPDERLFEEVTFLVEYPVPMGGHFSEEFLALPPEVLVTSMKGHQRYFPLEDEEGRLMPHFIAVNNTRVKDPSLVIKGHEKVLRARLSDARFFFQEDLKRPLIERVEHLKAVVFHSRLGTSYEKVERIVSLAECLSRKLVPEKTEIVKRCALLCKADLTSLMVGEFPDLQGVMGREYARRSGEAEEVAEGIFEHYLPLSSGGGLPRTDAGAIVGLADRLDSLVGFFGVDLIPTGSADPYALRRQAQGVILVIWDKGYPLSVREVLGRALSGYSGNLKKDDATVIQELLDFFALRLQYLLEGEGMQRETVEAVLAAPWDDFHEVRLRCLALGAFQDHPDFASLVAGCKRALNILKGISLAELPPLDPSRFQEEAERELWKKVEETAGKLAAHFQEKRYGEYLSLLASLRPYIDTFFDRVLVMAPEAALRHNRLALLARLTALFNRYAQLTKFSV